MKIIKVFFLFLIAWFWWSVSIAEGGNTFEKKPMDIYLETGVSLGLLQCFQSGLNGSSKGMEIIHESSKKIEAGWLVDFHYKDFQIFSHLQDAVFDNNFPEKYKGAAADTFISEDSRFNINSFNLYLKWNGLYWGSLNIQPLAGLHGTLISADIDGEVKATGQRITYVFDTYRKVGPLAGVNMVIPLYPFNPRGKKVVLSLEPEYNYVFGEQRLNIYGGQIAWDISDPETKKLHESKLFLRFVHEEGGRIRLQHWLGGFLFRIPI